MLPLTPLDGRYAEKVSALLPYISEFAYVKYRASVEIAWFLHITKLTNVPVSSVLQDTFQELVENFDEAAFSAVKEIENEVKHDVKAIELWLARILEENNASELKPYLHIGRTSEDINSVAYALMLRDMRGNVLSPLIQQMRDATATLATTYADTPMLARTHGQPASSTTFGKECAVYVSRIDRQAHNVSNVEIFAKFGGATGTFAADSVAYAGINWPEQMNIFVSGLGLSYNTVTTQIEPHDWIVRMCNEYALIGSICTDIARDFWQYISMGYMVQSVNKNEVGSSTMPHKVNPIDFENAEANFGLANALFRHFADKLPISRMQRDLSDSSTLRALSEAFGHFVVGLKSLQTGITKITVDEEKLLSELQNHWELLAEPIQTVMRKNGMQDAYEQMKRFSRGKSITKEEIQEFIHSLDIDEEDKQRLLSLTPESYVGYAASIARSVA